MLLTPWAHTVLTLDVLDQLLCIFALSHFPVMMPSLRFTLEKLLLPFLLTDLKGIFCEFILMSIAWKHKMMP